MKTLAVSSKIESSIYILRGMKVMMDSDLAVIYGIETKRLLEQVERNIERFPEDFMFQCDNSELEGLRSQIATANPLTYQKHKRRNLPYFFTENGVAMLSSVLNSKVAIQINIEIMRIFTKLRSFHALEEERDLKMKRLEQDTKKFFKLVFKKLDEHDHLLKPYLPNVRKKIGLKE